MTYITTSPAPADSIDLLELEYEIRKARGDFDKAKPRIASKEDIARDRAIRMRVARTEELMNENYSLDDIAFMTGEPKHVVARDIETVRAKQREKEKRIQFISDMMFGSSTSSGYSILMR